jgi:hypothetical protein
VLTCDPSRSPGPRYHAATQDLRPARHQHGARRPSRDGRRCDGLTATLAPRISRDSRGEDARIAIAPAPACSVTTLAPAAAHWSTVRRGSPAIRAQAAYELAALAGPCGAIRMARHPEPVSYVCVLRSTLALEQRVGLPERGIVPEDPCAGGKSITPGTASAVSHNLA